MCSALWEDTQCIILVLLAQSNEQKWLAKDMPGIRSKVLCSSLKQTNKQATESPSLGDGSAVVCVPDRLYEFKWDLVLVFSCTGIRGCLAFGLFGGAPWWTQLWSSANTTKQGQAPAQFPARQVSLLPPHPETSAALKFQVSPEIWSWMSLACVPPGLNPGSGRHSHQPGTAQRGSEGSKNHLHLVSQSTSWCFNNNDS